MELVPYVDRAQRRGLPILGPRQTDGGSVNCAIHTCNPVVLSSCDHPPECDSKRTCISFSAVEAPTEEERFWPFGRTDDPVASFEYSVSGDVPTNNSGLLGGFDDVTGEKTGGVAVMVKKGPVRGLGLQNCITMIH